MRLKHLGIENTPIDFDVTDHKGAFERKKSDILSYAQFIVNQEKVQFQLIIF